MGRRLRTLTILALTCATVVSAQPETTGWGRRELPYDSQFTFVRLRWRSGSFGARVSTGEIGAANQWLHEFPRAEKNLMAVLKELTLVDAKVDTSLILQLDDPNLFNYPIAMMWEPGFWRMTDEQAKRLREYFLKGGFIIFNDFEQDQWNNFEAQMRRVLPDARLVSMDLKHPVFDSFFELATPEFKHPPNHHLYGFKPKYFGIFEDNDPSGRLMAIVNYNTNLAEFWQMVDAGFYFLPTDSTSDAFRLGVNYMLYGLTH
jgi:hypothetical protein